MMCVYVCVCSPTNRQEKMRKLQEQLTSTYRLKAENADQMLRLKDQAELDEKALMQKEKE